MLDIVLDNFSPTEVTAAINNLLAQPEWENRALYKAVWIALRQLEGRLTDRQRTVDMVATKVSDQPEFSKVG